MIKVLEYKANHIKTKIKPQFFRDVAKTLKEQKRTGHWIYDNFNYRCSECNETPKTIGYVGTADFMTEHFKFCNHCGAKMIEPQESEVKEEV